MKLEFLKYEIREFTIDYSKTAAKIRKLEQFITKTKNLENDLSSEETLQPL